LIIRSAVVVDDAADGVVAAIEGAPERIITAMIRREFADRRVPVVGTHVEVCGQGDGVARIVGVECCDIVGQQCEFRRAGDVNVCPAGRGEGRGLVVAPVAVLCPRRSAGHHEGERHDRPHEFDFEY